MTTTIKPRSRAREILVRNECISPASVYDALSARVAEQVGFGLGLLSGSVASMTTLAAPDLIVLTMSEFAEQVRRIMRVSNLSLLVDADHGYGNALNVMRTVNELEHAGVSILGIEDTVQPLPFAHSGPVGLVPIAEMTGKLRAALAARQDPELVIAARLAGARVEGLEGTVARAKAYAQTGVDALFVVEVDDIEIIRGVSAATTLPLIIGSGKMTSMRRELTPLRARILLQGHQPVAAAVRALRGAYEHLHRGGVPAEMEPSIASSAELDELMHAGEYATARREYLQ